MIYDIAVVGGGIIGLATARALLLRHPQLKLVLIEKETALSRHQSGRNSGVIHSGIYYTPGSLKARLCVEGRKALMDYCDLKHIEYRTIGKLIIATHHLELPQLERLLENGKANGINDLQLLDEYALEQRVPGFTGINALWSPSTAIVDFTQVALAYADDIRAAGGEIFTGREITGITRGASSMELMTREGALEARKVITCGGLQADRLAQMTGGKVEPKIVPFRGKYMILHSDKAKLVTTNIYPVPNPAFPFLGPHFTPRMNGEVWLGPNAVLAFAREGYGMNDVNLADMFETLGYSGFLKLASKQWQTGVAEFTREVSVSAFISTFQQYMPELQVTDCSPGPSGVRAQAIDPSGDFVDDFVFEGYDGILHVRNAPSPAATSSLAIGNHIAEDVDRRFGL